MKSVYKNWFFLLFSDVSRSLLNFIIFIFLARKLSPQAYGDFNTVISISALFTTFAIGLGTNHVVIRELAINPKETKSFLKRVALWRFVSFAIAFSVLVIYGQKQMADIAALILFAAALVLADSIWDFAESISFGHFCTKYSMVLNFTFSLLWLLVILILPKNNVSLVLVLSLYTAFQFLRGLIYITVCYKIFIKSSHEESHTSSGAVLKMSLPYFWMRSLGSATDQTPILRLRAMGGAEQVGIYSVGNKLIYPITLAVNTGMKALFPYIARLYKENKQEFDSKLADGFSIALILGGTVAAGLIAVSSWLIAGLLGNDYLDSVGVLKFLSWYGVVLCSDSLLSTVLSSTYRQNVLAVITTLDVIFSLPLFVWAAGYGAKGLAVMRMIVSIVMVAYHLVVVAKVLKININSKQFWISCVYTAVLMITSLAVKNQVYQLGILAVMIGFITFTPYSPIRKYLFLLKNILNKD